MITIRAYADLHLFFDKNEAKRYLVELEVLKQELINNPPDLLVFCGDLTHKPYRSDETELVEVMRFVSDIVKICRGGNKYNKIIRWRNLNGTSSHDGKISETISKLYDYGDDVVKSFTKYNIEKIKFPNGEEYSFRWIPESYGEEEEHKEFVKTLYSDVVDMGFFHGSFRSVLEEWGVQDDYKPTTLPKSFIYEDDLTIEKTKFFTAGGHIHRHINIKDRIFYINSYTSHNFGDKGIDKGYMEFYVTPTSYEWKYIVNPLAPKFIDIEIKNIHKYEIIDDLVAFVNQHILLNDPERNKIRLFITGKSNHITNTNITFLKDYTKNWNVKFKIKLTQTENNEEQIEQDFYTDSTVSITDKIQRLLQEQFGKNMSKEKINEYINKELE